MRLENVGFARPQVFSSRSKIRENERKLSAEETKLENIRVEIDIESKVVEVLVNTLNPQISIFITNNKILFSICFDARVTVSIVFIRRFEIREK